MTNTNTIMMTTFVLLATFTLLTSVGLSQVYAEEETEGYKYADNLKPIVTFEFKDGSETLEFPIYIMEDDYIANNGSPSFTLQGTVTDSPHLHKALDEAYKYRQSLSFQWDYKYFDVEIDFVKNDLVVESLRYHDCKIQDYGIITLNDDYESYTSSKSGFAILDDIEFLCSGLNFEHFEDLVTYSPNEIHDMGSSPYEFAEDIRTFIEFEFDQGIERIEFPVFEIESGFEESDDNVTPAFKVEGLLTEHPLLSKAIDNARKVSGYQSGSNIDFEATVEFVKGDMLLRQLDFKDCRTTEYEIKSQFDKEEGFTGKRGFAITEIIDFECIGLDGVNPRLSELYGDTPSWTNPYFEYDTPAYDYSMADGVYAFVTFDLDDGKETSYFPRFAQGDTLSASSPTFTLVGAVGDHPQLYSKVDENLEITSATGASNFLELFKVTVELIRDDTVLRGFEYRDCRVTDYVVETEEDNEESYFKAFALTNEFDFECIGYHPLNPTYDALFDYEKVKTKTSKDYAAEQIPRGGVQQLFG